MLLFAYFACLFGVITIAGVSSDDASRKRDTHFLTKHVKNENNSMCFGMYIVLVIGKLAKSVLPFWYCNKKKLSTL